MMMKPLIFGIKKSEFQRIEYLSLEKRIISGSMEQVLAVHVLKFTMTVEKNMDVESRDVLSDAIVTDLLKSGTMYLRSLKMTAREIIQH